jgi:hypothetical protein
MEASTIAATLTLFKENLIGQHYEIILFPMVEVLMKPLQLFEKWS